MFLVQKNALCVFRSHTICFTYANGRSRAVNKTTTSIDLFDLLSATHQISRECYTETKSETHGQKLTDVDRKKSYIVSGASTTLYLPSSQANILQAYNSSRCVSRSGGGGGLRSLCIKINYSEPTRAESREGTSTLAESSGVT